MTTYSKDKVDALLNALDAAQMNGTNSRVDEAVAALRTKPAKFYVLPEWYALPSSSRFLFWHGRYQGATEIWSQSDMEIARVCWDRAREFTATDKPMVHIPAGEDWDQREINSLKNVWAGERRHDTNADWRAIINHIKAKLEGGKRCQ